MCKCPDRFIEITHLRSTNGSRVADGLGGSRPSWYIAYSRYSTLVCHRCLDYWRAKGPRVWRLAEMQGWVGTHATNGVETLRGDAYEAERCEEG